MGSDVGIGVFQSDGKKTWDFQGATNVFAARTNEVRTMERTTTGKFSISE